MMTDEFFDELTQAIQALGYDEATSAHYAALIGDTPATDADGKIVVEENGVVLAHLALNYFDEAGE